jgi:hypothetical protein
MRVRNCVDAQYVSPPCETDHEDVVFFYDRLAYG